MGSCGVSRTGDGAAGLKALVDGVADGIPVREGGMEVSIMPFVLVMPGIMEGAV